MTPTPHPLERSIQVMQDFLHGQRRTYNTAHLRALIEAARQLVARDQAEPRRKRHR